jgi:hypothetical protein
VVTLLGSLVTTAGILLVACDNGSTQPAPFDASPVAELSETLSTLFAKRIEVRNGGDEESYSALFAPGSTARLPQEFRPETLTALATAYAADGVQEQLISVQVTIESGEPADLVFSAKVRYQTITPEVTVPETTEMWLLRATLVQGPSGWLISSVGPAVGSQSDPDSDANSPALDQVHPEEQFPQVTTDAGGAAPYDLQCDTTYPYDTLSAIAYLDLWADKFNSEYPSYQDPRGFPNDCTNFASQVLFAGGREMLYGEKDDLGVWWYRKPAPTNWLGWPDKNHYSLSWALSRGLFHFIGNYTATEPVLGFASLAPGDVVFVDATNKSYRPGSGPDGLTEHTMFVHERLCSGGGLACILVSYHSSLPYAHMKVPLKTFDLRERTNYETDMVRYYALRPSQACPLQCKEPGETCNNALECCPTMECTSGVCSENGPTCFDGIENQNEISPDCGGVCDSLPGYCPYGPGSDGWYCGDPSKGQDPAKLYLCEQGMWIVSTVMDCGPAGCHVAAPCNSDSCNTAPGECSTNADCLPTEYCDTGWCIADVCPQGESYCASGSDLWQCNANGSSGVFVQACPFDCFAGACEACAPDCSSKCGGASDGCSGFCYTSCPDGYVCVGQSCVASGCPAEIDPPYPCQLVIPFSESTGWYSTPGDVLPSAPRTTTLSIATGNFSAQARIANGFLEVTKTLVGPVPSGNFGVNVYWADVGTGTRYVRFQCPAGDSFECSGSGAVVCNGGWQAMSYTSPDTNVMCGLGKSSGTTYVDFYAVTSQ